MSIAHAEGAGGPGGAAPPVQVSAGEAYAEEEDLMTDASDRCLHEPCTCVATQGEYCSDHCREHVGRDDAVCGCGHAVCAGMIGTADTAIS